MVEPIVDAIDGFQIDKVKVIYEAVKFTGVPIQSSWSSFFFVKAANDIEISTNNPSIMLC